MGTIPSPSTSRIIRIRGLRMETMKKVVMIMVVTTAVVLRVSPLASAIAGTATYYTEYTPSACYGYQDKGVMIAAASDVFWNNGAACGKKYTVRCTGPTNQGIPQPCKGGSVTVTIVDYCPSGCQGTIDLSYQAFNTIANPDAGKIKIDYNPV